MNKFFTNSVFYFLGNSSQKAYNILLLPLYIRKFSPEELGLLALYQTTSLILVKFTSAPHAIGITRFFYTKEFNKKSLITTILISGIIHSSFFSLVFYFVASSTLKPHLELLEFMTLITFLTPISHIILTIIRIQEKAKMFFTISFVQLLIGVSILLDFLYIDKFTITTIPLAESMSFIVGIVIGGFFLSPQFKRSKLRIIKRILSYSYPQLGSSLALTVINNADRYSVEFILGTKYVGILTLAQQISKVVKLILFDPITKSIEPTIYKILERPKILGRFLQQSSIKFVKLATIVSIPLIFFSIFILPLFEGNPDYQISSKILYLYVVAIGLNSLGFYTNWGLIKAMKSFIISRNTLIISAINIILNLVLIKIFGLHGAAFSAIITAIIWNRIKLHYTKNLLNIELPTKQWYFYFILIVFISNIFLLIKSYWL